MSLPQYDRTLQIKRIIQETSETKSFCMDIANEPFAFTPGQFVNVTANVTPQNRIRRAYSIASSPLDPEIVLTVKKMEFGRLSKYLCDVVKEGDSLNVRGPYGRFVLDRDTDLVFIAGGSGVVPFRSMWRFIRQTKSEQKICLLYASKSARHIIYRDELEELAREHRVVHTFTANNDPAWEGYSRRIDADMLKEVIGDFTGKLFYACGPPTLCECVVGILSGFGVEGERIRLEKYD
jgi:ferredoxin-NADP reductase